MEPSNSPVHITHLYFFAELDKTLGYSAASQWLVGEFSSERAKRKLKCIQTEDKSITTRQIPNHRSHNDGRQICKPAPLHAWDIKQIDFAVSEDEQLVRIRSCPAVLSLQAKDETNFGLIFTDAAHTVINDDFLCSSKIHDNVKVCEIKLHQTNGRP